MGAPNFYEAFIVYRFSRLQQSDCQGVSYMSKINSSHLDDGVKASMRSFLGFHASAIRRARCRVSPRPERAKFLLNGRDPSR